MVRALRVTVHHASEINDREGTGQDCECDPRGSSISQYELALADQGWMD